MKKIIWMMVILTGHIAYCQESGIEFKKGSWEDAQLLAKQSDKPLFIYVYSPGCHFCKKMETSVFPDKKVADYYNASFINYKLDLEQGQGVDLANKYHINAFPTYVYFDKEGHLLHISGSEKPANDFIQDGKNAFDSDKAYTSLKARYDNGNRSPDLLYNFTTALSYANISDKITDQVAAAYLQTQSEKDITSKKNLDFIFNQSLAFDAPATPYFFKYYNLLLQSYGSAEVNAKSRRIVGFAASEAGSKKDSSELSYLIKFLKETSIKEKEELIALSAVKYKLSIFISDKTKWLNYADAAIAYTKEYGSHDNFTGREAATYLYYYAASSESLRKAVQLIDMAIAVDASYDNILLRAKLFHKMGDNNKAMDYAKRAMAIANEKKEDNADAKDLLDEILVSEKK